LSLPATLTEDEVLTLHGRNADNALFVRALNKYVEDKGIELHHTIADRATVQREAINKAWGTMDYSIRNGDQNLFAVYEKQGGQHEAETALADL